jgi:hypothetical protein
LGASDVGGIFGSISLKHLQVWHVDFVCLFLQVFPYGSVPLKTFLPDGDIDLTAISCPNIEDSLVSDVHAVLRGEEHNKAAPYEVRDVHCIDAEVLSTLSTLKLKILWWIGLCHCARGLTFSSLAIPYY